MKAIYLPSGDHCASLSWPLCVSGVSLPVCCRHSHRSSRNRSCCQSGDVVETTAELPSGEKDGRWKSVELKNLSSVITSFVVCATTGTAKHNAVDAKANAASRTS